MKLFLKKQEKMKCPCVLCICIMSCKGFYVHYCGYGNCHPKQFTQNFFPSANTLRRTWLSAEVNLGGPPDLSWDKDTSLLYKFWSSTTWHSCYDFSMSLKPFPFGCFIYISEKCKIHRLCIISINMNPFYEVLCFPFMKSGVSSSLPHKPLDY